MADEKPDLQRRQLLTTATAAVGGVAVGATAAPFVQSMMPNVKGLETMGDIEVDISDLKPGELRVTVWRNMPVWILYRTPEMLRNIQALEDQVRDPGFEVTSQQPKYAENWHRSIKPEIFVAVGVCTHLGCSPRFKPEYAISEVGDWWRGGFFCYCHRSKYDFSGRVFKGDSPAPRNLAIPPYRFVSDTRIVIGDLTAPS